MTHVFIPSPMRIYTKGLSTLEATGKNIGKLVDSLEDQYPGLKSAIACENGDLRPGLAIAIDGKVVSRGFLEQVNDGKEVTFFLAINGG